MENEIFEVILGTYEEFILGYKYIEQQKKPPQSFASHSHTSSIRSVAQEGTLLASGGADDRIVIYDLKLRKEKCTLDHHKGTVNCLQFTKNTSHIISGGADGVLAIVRVGTWMLEKIWEKAHKGQPIIDIAIHSSGKLALTLGGDCTLITWNLIKGRKAFAVNLNSKSSDAKSLQSIKWAPNGVNFVLAGGKFTEIWSIETGGIVTSIEHEERVVCCLWITDETLVVGYDNGKIGTVNITSSEIEIIEGHNSRIKAVSMYEDYFVTACSNGEVKIWDTNFKQIAKFDTGCRLTCLCILPLQTKPAEATNSKTVKRVVDTEVTKPSSNKKKKRHSDEWKVEKLNK